METSISPSNEYSELISFRIEWFDLLAVQMSLKRLLQYHNSKASIVWCSVYLMVQLSHMYMTTGKIIALTMYFVIQNFNNVRYLLFNMLSRFVIGFFSKEKASLNFMTAVVIHSDFAVQGNETCHCFYILPFCLS